jgi:hypothetical protein
VTEQYEPFDPRWFTQTRIVCAALTTTFLLLTFVLWFMLDGPAAEGATAVISPAVPTVQYILFTALALVSLPLALFVRKRTLAATQQLVDQNGQALTGSVAARGRIGVAAVVGMALPEVSILLGFVLGFLSESWTPYLPFAAWGVLGWAIMFPRTSQLREWYERQSAGSDLPQMNAGGPA